MTQVDLTITATVPFPLELEGTLAPLYKNEFKGFDK